MECKFLFLVDFNEVFEVMFFCCWGMWEGFIKFFDCLLLFLEDILLFIVLLDNIVD